MRGTKLDLLPTETEAGMILHILSNMHLGRQEEREDTVLSQGHFSSCGSIAHQRICVQKQA